MRVKNVCCRTMTKIKDMKIWIRNPQAIRNLADISSLNTRQNEYKVDSSIDAIIPNNNYILILLKLKNTLITF